MDEPKNGNASTNPTLEKLSKVFFKQTSYEHELDDKIQAIRTHAQRFDEIARLCSYETISETHQALASHWKEWRETQQNIVGRLERSRYENAQETWQLGNSLLSEAGNIQETMGTMSNRIKMLEVTLARFLASNERINYKAESRQLAPSSPILSSSVSDTN